MGVQESIVWAVAGLRELLCGCWCGRESTLWEFVRVQESIMGEVAGLRGLLCGRSWVGKQSVGACGAQASILWAVAGQLKGRRFVDCLLGRKRAGGTTIC